MTAAEKKYAFVFPGQGSQTLKMLQTAKALPEFESFYSQVCKIAGEDIFEEIGKHGESYLNRNAISSLMTVLLSALHFEKYKTAPALTKTFAGYSVGQWTAIYASGAIDYATLIQVVFQRAKIMDRFSGRTDSGMLAVIGVKEEVLEEICSSLRNAGQKIWISNYNAPTQYTVAGLKASLEEAQKLIQQKTPKKMLALSVAGAWHCPLLEEAGLEFKKFLGDLQINVRADTVIDNVTGRFLPSDSEALREQLGAHVCRPVQWEKGLQTLAAQGTQVFQEVGFGNMLTKYGFFIDRVGEHQPGLS